MTQDTRGPKIPDHVRRAVLGGCLDANLGRILTPINPAAEQSEASSFEELCHELEAKNRAQQAEIERLRAALTDFATTGLRCDLTPTRMVGPKLTVDASEAWWTHYLSLASDSVRGRARAALKEPS